MQPSPSLRISYPMASSPAIASLHCAFRASQAASSFPPRPPPVLSFPRHPHVLPCSSPGTHPAPPLSTLSAQISHFPNLRRPSVCAMKGECQHEEIQENPLQSSASHRLLPHALHPNLLPKHVAMVMDGHSRWAEKRGLATEAGHRQGITVVLPEIVRLSSTWGIEALTVYAFSTENWSRPKIEVDFYMSMIELLLNEQLENWKRRNIQLRVIGDLSKLSKSLRGLITQAEDYTKHNFGLKLNIALSYSGRYDILQACQQLATQVEVGKLKSTDITELLFEKQLKTGYLECFGSPDLLIRTSGEQRLSNFLLWQMAYTELYFMDALWPEFEESLYVEALQSFQHRKRRFGKRIKN